MLTSQVLRVDFILVKDLEIAIVCLLDRLKQALNYIKMITMREIKRVKGYPHCGDFFFHSKSSCQ